MTAAHWHFSCCFYDPNTQYIYSSSATRITPEILQFAYDNKYL